MKSLQVKGLLMKDRLTKTDYEIFAKNILLHKKEHLSPVYDNVLGTDKWLVTK